MTWGNAGFGGDSSAVQDQLRAVQHILADGSVVTWGIMQALAATVTQRAFAVILADGSVVTWGICSRFRPHMAHLCCNFGRCIRRDLGRSRVWRRQFGGSRSAQGCAADSGHRWRICCKLRFSQVGSVVT